MGLRENAARAAGRPTPSGPIDGPEVAALLGSEGTGEVSPVQTEATELPAPPELPATTSDDPAPVPVHTALLRAIRDLGFVKKLGTYEQGRTRYNYRSVDAVVNAASVVMERHGLLFLPEVVEYADRDIQATSGTRMSLATTKTRWNIVGPMGDILYAGVTTIGHALDTSDKAYNKAQSVAWRIALVQVFQIATGDPDPDSVRIDRGEAPAFNANAYRDEALNPDTTVARLSQMIQELKNLEQGHVLLDNEVGEPEKIGNLIIRVRRERAQ